ncbi:MAG TPA: hypothetical protein VLH19_05770 [Patescibacteria group bacterium]|nr:hypothetical protein [Patescibacteria group bacterium]
MQFSKEMIQIQKKLESWNWQVFTPDFSEKANTNTSKREYINNHFFRIHKADSILVVNIRKKNIQGYIGSNVLLEIGAAHILGKMIYILNDLGAQGCTEEVTALTSQNLSGDVTLLK